MKTDRSILLTFDVEEFDLPLEYNIHISDEEALSVGKKGLDLVSHVIAKQAIPTTLFTTANFALNYPDTIKALSKTNEIASHAFYHGSFEREDLLKSRNTLETICESKVEGLRMPRLRKVDMSWVQEAGYSYDSSINPTYIPGRYNNRHLPRTIYREQGMVRLPVSVSPNFRIPLFWLSFKNFPYSFYKRIALQTLRKDGYLSLYFHPWEFTNIRGYPIPFYLKKDCGELLVDRLNQLIADLKKEGEFRTISSFLKERVVT